MDKITKDINILTISSDMSILSPESEARQRMKDYGSLVNRMSIVIYNGRFWGGKEEKVYQIANNIFVYPRSFLGLLGLFRVSSKKLSFVLSHKVDLVSSQDPFIFGFIGRSLARWLRAGFQVQIHTDFLSPYFIKESLYNRIKVRIAKNIIKSATGIRVVSQRIADSLGDLGLKVKPVVLPIWTDIAVIKNSPINIDLKKKYPQFGKIFLMASRVTVEKNIFLAVNAMKHALKDRADVGLIIVGDGPFKKLIAGFIRGEDLQKKVIFENWSNDLPSYYKTCDVFLNTSNYEGYGRTIVEALAAGAPVITTDVGVAREFVKNSENGFIVPVGSKKDLEEAIFRVINDDNVLSALKKGANSTILDLGSKEEYLDKYSRSWINSI